MEKLIASKKTVAVAEASRLVAENTRLSYRVSEQERTIKNFKKDANKNLEIYDEHGVLRKKLSTTMSESSNEDVQRLTDQLFIKETVITTLENQRDELTTKTLTLEKENRMLLEKETTKRGGIVVGLGVDQATNPTAMIFKLFMTITLSLTAKV